ncbi:MAG: hypothetical protein BZ151_04500 [Desulfobacca sp. 4484_104]|nr:MAG: hypothetical protein BZ151_04500 [Desulfobacca sp. 4484_104]RLA89249.1 MAG: hypothetical protein DRG58_05610 [Deltaproteobacteria bacterium]
MRSKGKIILLAAIAALVLVPALCWAEMFVEGYVGGTFGANSDVDVSAAGASATLDDAKIDPSVIGGLKVGYWFTKEGFLGYDYPDWMKYLGFALDLSYHNLDLRPQETRVTGVPGIASIRSWDDGRAFTVGFMFMGRYGFLPDSEVPFGRLQPYVAVGPALVISTFEPTISVPGGPVVPLGRDTTTEIALMTDVGLRYMALKNVSLDVAFRYRYTEPSYDYDFAGTSVSIDPEYHLFSFYAGAALHF